MRRTLCFFCCLLCLPSFFLFAAAGTDAQAYSYPEPEVLQIDLIMQPSRYLRMIHSAEKQKYPAVVCIDDGDPQSVGVQVRGDRSLREGMEMYCKRVPLELCFDYAGSDGAFRGNPSLKLINCLTPARLLTQIIAMQTFEYMGIPAPRVTPAFIRINDTDFGLYLAVEDLNEAFARDRFGGATLYRPLSAKDDADKRTVVSFDTIRMVLKVDGGGSALSQYTEAKCSSQNADMYLDVDEFLRYMACETFIMDDDGFMDSRRNFYLADDHGKLKLLPWDKDNVFSAFEERNSFREFEDRSNPLFQEMMQNASYAARYRQYLQMLVDAFLDPDAFLPWLDAYIRALEPYFRRDGTIARYADDVIAELTTGNALFNTMSGNLMLTFRTFHDQADAQLRGTAAGFSVPQDMTLASYSVLSGDKQDEWGTDRSVIFRVCAGYWRLRRQALFDNEGKATLVISVFFALVFAATLICVYHPAAPRRRKKIHEEEH